MSAPRSLADIMAPTFKRLGLPVDDRTAGVALSDEAVGAMLARSNVDLNNEAAVIGHLSKLGVRVSRVNLDIAIAAAKRNPEP